MAAHVRINPSPEPSSASAQDEALWPLRPFLLGLGKCGSSCVGALAIAQEPFIPHCRQRTPQSVICDRPTTFFPSLRPRAGLVIFWPVRCCGVRTHGNWMPFPWPPAPGSLTFFTIDSVQMSPHSPLFSIYIADQRLRPAACRLPSSGRQKGAVLKRAGLEVAPGKSLVHEPSSSHTATFYYTATMPTSVLASLPSP